MDRRSGRFRPPDQQEWVQPCYVTVPCAQFPAPFYSTDASQLSVSHYPYWLDSCQQHHHSPQAYGYPQQAWAGQPPPPPLPPPPPQRQPQHASQRTSDAVASSSADAAAVAVSDASVRSSANASSSHRDAAPHQPLQPEPSSSTPYHQPHRYSSHASHQQQQLAHSQQPQQQLPHGQQQHTHPPVPSYHLQPHHHHMMPAPPPLQYYEQGQYPSQQGQYASMMQYYQPQHAPAVARCAGHASTSACTGHGGYLPGPPLQWPAGAQQQPQQQHRAGVPRQGASRSGISTSAAASAPLALSSSAGAHGHDRQATDASSRTGPTLHEAASLLLRHGRDAAAEPSGNISDGDDDSTAGTPQWPHISPNFQISPSADDWGTLTEGLLQRIVLRLGNEDIKHVRLVGRHWRAVVDHNIEQLSPNVMCSVVIVTRFRNLRMLHLTNCANVRNRDLMIIAKSGLRLHTLTLGDDTTKPWVTNKGLAHIAKMPTLTALHLQDCNSVTNNGIACLHALRKLSVLSLKGCRKLTNTGLETLQSNTALTSLNLYGCIKIGDEGLAPLSGLRLVTLTLGMTRVRDEGVKYLSAITTLQELSFSHEEMTYAGLKHLSGLTNLQSLAVRENLSLNGEALVEVVPQLSKLHSLDLFRNCGFRDDQLARCLSSVGNVTFLDLRGTAVTQEGINQLSQLGNLQKLCVQPPHVDMWEPYMLVLANLTQLVSLTINNCTVLSMRLLGSLRPLNRLLELDLSDDKFLESLEPKDTVQTQHVEVMASLSSLTSLDLSRRPISEQHLVVLAERLPRLRSLFVVGCPVLNDELTSLQRRFPDLAIHRKPLSDGSSCSSSEVGY